MRDDDPTDGVKPRYEVHGRAAAGEFRRRCQKAWYVSELARRMGVPSSSLQRELQQLTEAGILKSHREGRMV
jgi:DNA-binding transcriptional ArsR family regulator